MSSSSCAPDGGKVFPLKHGRFSRANLPPQQSDFALRAHRPPGGGRARQPPVPRQARMVSARPSTCSVMQARWLPASSRVSSRGIVLLPFAHGVPPRPPPAGRAKAAGSSARRTASAGSPPSPTGIPAARPSADRTMSAHAARGDASGRGRRRPPLPPASRPEPPQQPCPNAAEPPPEDRPLLPQVETQPAFEPRRQEMPAAEMVKLRGRAFQPRRRPRRSASRRKVLQAAVLRRWRR